MLINRIGVDEGDDVVDIRSRRPPVAIDPKSRETMTALLVAMMSAYATGDAPVSSRSLRSALPRDASTSPIGRAVAGRHQHRSAA